MTVVAQDQARAQQHVDPDGDPRRPRPGATSHTWWVCQLDSNRRPVMQLEVAGRAKAMETIERWMGLPLGRAGDVAVLRVETVDALGRAQTIVEYERAWKRVALAPQMGLLS